MDLATRWGVTPTWDECDEMGIDRKFGKPPKAAKILVSS